MKEIYTLFTQPPPSSSLGGERERERESVCVRGGRWESEEQLQGVKKRRKREEGREEEEEEKGDGLQ